MKKILVTGAAGFIGSHLCDYLLNNNNEVFAIDNFLTGSINNIKHNFKNKNFNFLEHDVCQSLKIDDKLDFIFHLASPASPFHYLKFPIETLKTSSTGTEKILKLALKNNAKILIASTSEIYGDPKEHPQKENYFGNVNPIGPRSVYDEAKRFQESLTTAYHTFHGLDIRIARIFNTYGPRMRIDDGRAIPSFIYKALNNEFITIFGNGTQTRSFCYIDDLINGLIKLSESRYTKPVNLGNPEEISINSLAEEVINVCNSKSKIIYKPLTENDPLRRNPDISKAKEILNWIPNINRKEGLEKTLDYFKSIV